MPSASGERITTSVLGAYVDAYAKYGPARQKEFLDQELVGRLAEHWAAGRSYGARVDTLLERLVKFLEAIRNALRGLGFQTADDVFARVVSGEIARRPEGGRREPTFGQSPDFAAFIGPNPITRPVELESGHALDSIEYQTGANAPTKERQLANAFRDEFGFKEPRIRPRDRANAEAALKALRLVAEITGIPRNLIGSTAGARLSLSDTKGYGGGFRPPMFFGLLGAKVHIGSAYVDAAVHELGHMLDNAAARRKGFASLRKKMFNPLDFAPSIEAQTDFSWLTERVAGGYAALANTIADPRSHLVLHAREMDRRVGDFYHSQPSELFARAFEVYIAEKAKALGYDVRTFADRIDLSSYRSKDWSGPVKREHEAERNALVAAFDAIFAGVRQNAEAGSTVLFSLTVPPRRPKQPSGVFAARPELSRWLGIPVKEFFANVDHIATKREKKDDRTVHRDLSTPAAVSAAIDEVLDGAAFSFPYTMPGRSTAGSIVLAKPLADGGHLVVGLDTDKEHRGRFFIRTVFHADAIARKVAESVASGSEIKRRPDPEAIEAILTVLRQAPEWRRGDVQPLIAELESELSQE